MRHFEWDEDKSRSNLEKHGVSFRTAETVFDDPLGIKLDDVSHSSLKEVRELAIGATDLGTLVVVFTIRGIPPVYRLISARRASRKERSLYEKAKKKSKSES